MSEPATEPGDAGASSRLESLWSGDFGDEYTRRNDAVDEGRRDFWAPLLGRLGVGSALEIGCNAGQNLRWIAAELGESNTAGVDVNDEALARLRERMPGVDARRSSGQSVPFADERFELVFTMGVLIHQDEDALEQMMAEVVRCSSRYVLCGEYFSEQDVEVPYRGQRGALFKRDFGGLYERRFENLERIEEGFLARADGPFDDVTYWVFEKRSA